MRKWHIFLSILISINILGCATVEVEKDQKVLFFPPAPEEPRLQFLKSFSSSKDIEKNPSHFEKFVTGEDTDLKPIVKPYGVVVHNGKIYICDTVSNSIIILDLAKSTFRYFRPKGRHQLMAPVNLAVSPKGDLYVADSRRGQVIIFDSSDEFVGIIGEKGETRPTDVAIFKDRLYVCDLKTQTVRIYDIASRDYIGVFPKDSDQREEAKLFSPTNIDIDEVGNVYVSDVGGFNVKKYSPEGEFIQAYGGGIGDAPGNFARPKGVAVDKEGRVYIVDAAFNNVQIFNDKGELLLFFPEEGDNIQFLLPAGVFIDYDNIEYFRPFIDKNFDVEYLVLVTSQYGGRKVNVFGFGKKK